MLRPIGRGGMGLVFLAHDLLLDRVVAIKFISAPNPDPRARQRFLTEARAVARLQHPNVVAVFRTGDVDGHPFLVSEYVRGRSLNLLRGPLPPAQVLKLGIGLARGLSAAHRQGVLHRDIKPANAIVSADGEVKLLDFGLAKLSSEPAEPEREGRAHGPLSSEGKGRLWDHDVTLPGLVVGTPRYIAPELWSLEPATRRSDVYALGAVLHELLTGAPLEAPQAPPTATPSSSTSAATAPTPPGGPTPPGARSPSRLQRLLSSAAPAQAPLTSRLVAIIETCVLPEASRRYPDGDALREALERLAAEEEPAPRLPPGNPYRGLLPFEAEHRALFFGRGAEVRAVLERLRYEPALVIVGDSGVGKSSLCRAAVIPALGKQAPPSGELHTALPSGMACALMTPGRRPLRALAAALRALQPAGAHLGTSEDDDEAVAATLTMEPSALVRLLHKARGTTAGALLFVDQLEELITLADPHEAATFAAALSELGLGRHDLRLLCTARGDFLTRLLSLPGFAQLLPRALFLLHPPTEAQVREAILGPAQRTGLRFDPESLVDELTAEAVRTPGGLPLLQFALAELWEARDVATERIPASALQAIGGGAHRGAARSAIGGALARHAEAVLSALPAPSRQAVRRILTRLLLPDGTRARCLEGELPTDEASRLALAALIRGRLVVAREVAGEASYELAHEALVAGWARLQDWLAADAELRALERRLHTAAAEWERLGQAPDALWGRRQLAEVGRLLPRDAVKAHEPLQQAFLRASRRAVWRARLSRDLGLAALPLLLLGAGLLTEQLAARRLRHAVVEQLTEARTALSDARQQSAHARRLRARAAPALRRAPRLRLSEGPAQDQDAQDYEAALQAEQEAHGAYARATRALEAAQLLDARRRDVRAALATVLSERLTLLDAFYRGALREELAQRLQALTATGDFDKAAAQRLSAPATLIIHPDPVGARLQLERYQREAGRLVLLAQGELRAGEPQALPAGSYRVIATYPGRALTRLPLVLRAGEPSTLPLWLPSAAAVPPGFVYVPAGHSLYGSADVEDLRSFLMAAPQHSVYSKAFLIGEAETTIGDWLVFLRALPRAERARRLLKANGALDLELQEESGGRFALRLRSNAVERRAREGERLTLHRRAGRGTLDWTRLPVSGINLEDATAYLRWLAESGRVPGARLCSDAEWERAARGADGRLYPHGDELRPEDAVFDETFGRDPDAYGPDVVMSRPSSVSPFGVFDMAGNVFEPVRLEQGVAYRGGSFYLTRLVARSNNRDPGDASARDPQVGLRVCASLPE